MPDRIIRVRAGRDLRVFFPTAVVAAPGRRTRVLEGEEVIEVPANNRFVQRSLQVGDLVLVEGAGDDVIQGNEGRRTGRHDAED